MEFVRYFLEIYTAQFPFVYSHPMVLKCAVQVLEPHFDRVKLQDMLYIYFFLKNVILVL